MSSRACSKRAARAGPTARVAAAALARQLLARFGIEVRSHIFVLGHERVADPLSVTFAQVAAIPADSPLRCVDPVVEARMVAAIDAAREAGDTLGGAFEVIATGVPVGLGSHVQW
ncbi:MAG: chorismate synthase, partial [Steroidobacteraceae bacterium]